MMGDAMVKEEIHKVSHHLGSVSGSRDEWDRVKKIDESRQGVWMDDRQISTTINKCVSIDDDLG